MHDLILILERRREDHLYLAHECRNVVNVILPRKTAIEKLFDEYIQKHLDTFSALDRPISTDSDFLDLDDLILLDPPSNLISAVVLEILTELSPRAVIEFRDLVHSEVTRCFSEKVNKLISKK